MQLMHLMHLKLAKLLIKGGGGKYFCFNVNPQLLESHDCVGIAAFIKKK